MDGKIEIISAISKAFTGVTLDGGISIDQSRVIDNYGRGASPEEFKRLPDKEITDDWSKIPTEVLDDYDCVAHLDEKGLRYYLPALMIRLLDNYDSGSMMTIATLSALYPKTESRESNLSEMNMEQRRAIAKFLKALPGLVELEGEDRTVVPRAYNRYWSRYLSE
ncbi:MAG: hypothetical protein QUS14_06665 [Pyrinomonadaceae bacterium]|nr:hypothetical protein [Pyrinomonadaceae bacterium]